MQHMLHIYHVNDLHSHFEQWPGIVHYIKEKRKEHESKGEHCLFLDVGDFNDRFHPITEASHGKWNTALLNHGEVDGITIGNNEGITLSHQHLDTLYENRQFDVLVANLFYADGTKPTWIDPYTIYEFENLRVGVIGVTVPFVGLYRQLGWKVKQPIDVLQQLIPEIRPQVDVLVLLSHLGLGDDETIADCFPEVDIILGGHTHHVLQVGKNLNGVLVCSAGKYGMYVGHVEVACTNRFIQSKKASLLATDSFLGIDFSTLSLLHQFERQAEEKLMKHVATLEQDEQIDWYKETPFVRQLATSIREWCQADIGMVNAGVLLNSLPKGTITKKTIHEICPHPINPCAITLQGELLKKIITKAATKEIETLEIKGLGFRGKVMGKMIYDGVTEQNGVIFINGDALQNDKMYRLGTLDMFTFGYIFPELAHQEKTYYMPELLRDVVQWQLEKG